MHVFEHKGNNANELTNEFLCLEFRDSKSERKND
jgi:hypothetical protein